MTSDGIAWNAQHDADGFEISRSTTMIGGYSTIEAFSIREGGTVSATVASGYFSNVRAWCVVDGVTYYSEWS